MASHSAFSSRGGPGGVLDSRPASIKVGSNGGAQVRMRQFRICEAMKVLAANRRGGLEDSCTKRTTSPLNPPARPAAPLDQRTTVPLRRGEGTALSPLRGEGVARVVFEEFGHHAARRYRVEVRS